MEEARRLTKTEISWILYDVASSAFTMLVSTTIPLFFAQLVEEAGMDASTASGLWGLVTAAAVLILAVLSPILGAVADYRGMKRRLFLGALVLGLLGAVGLACTTHWLWFLWLLRFLWFWLRCRLPRRCRLHRPPCLALWRRHRQPRATLVHTSARR